MARRWMGLVFALTFLQCLPGLAQSPLGRIEGTIQTETGQLIRGARVTAAPVKAPPDGALGRPFFAISAPDGTFVLDQIPGNVYSICGEVVGSELLDPCMWSATPTTVDLSDGATHSGIVIALAQGRFVHVRVTDSGQLLRKSEKRNAGAQPFFMHLLGPHGPIPVMPIIDYDSGRTFRTVVPFDTQFTLRINSGTLQMLDKAGKPLTNIGTQQPAQNGGAQPPAQNANYQQAFKIGKADAPPTFEFSVRQP